MGSERSTSLARPLVARPATTATSTSLSKLSRWTDCAFLAPFVLEFTRGSPWRVFAPPLWGRIKEGGRAVLCDKGAAARSIISSDRATPHPCPPPPWGVRKNARLSTGYEGAER